MKLLLSPKEDQSFSAFSSAEPSNSIHPGGIIAELFPVDGITSVNPEASASILA